jgi:hypothetical protein
MKNINPENNLIVEDLISKHMNEETNLNIVERIEILIKALGTMVIIPQYVIDEGSITKRYNGGIQQPILQDEARVEAENKLLELIKQL